MKMENIIKSDHNVTVAKINFNEGEPVGIGQTLIDFVKEEVID